jgi:hypothetical protein
VLSAGGEWNPFSPELPTGALLATPRIDHFAWRVEQMVQEGGFALLTGESGTGKSVVLRIVAGRLQRLRDVTVGVLERPQSKTNDFYREMADLFAVKLPPFNRWGGFKALRERWKTHLASSQVRPVLLIDEAQEMNPDVLSTVLWTAHDSERPPGACGLGCCCWIRWCDSIASTRTTPMRSRSCWPTSVPCNGSLTSRSCWCTTRARAPRGDLRPVRG